ncbi:hypothetical protein M409DRAFT_17488 [Zasmidium cellare ATCC 36951]|uniref:Uncharacterized protein n=1 Tax=Zasmidium cellare ATCC 36951 TaxID=1080233 RepID=A0A6A6D1D3_ZASCE|nr:uncharacterized protein M409DRAFT_17488 [Zasmidium cellare ATCC 36951]KAF2172250.1 hypothetical protein M409DRAFT_17488 [Zasmidium cellare ATCC 36951]
MSNNDATFEGLPPEIREMIYEYAFTAFNADCTALPIDILTYRRAVPNSGSLRSTNKPIFNKSRRAYLKARADLAAERKQVLADMVRNWEVLLSKRDDLNRPHDWKDFHQIDTLVKNLKSGNSTCKNHKCAIDNCYMCENPEHQTCFDCGRNAATALYGYLLNHLCPHVYRKQAPELVIPNSDGKISDHPLAKLIDSLPRKHTSRTVVHPTTGVNMSVQSWAFSYWYRQLHLQRGQDIRCCIRTRAHTRVFEMFGNIGCDADDKVLRANFEESDPMMAVYDEARKMLDYCGGTKIECESEYLKRINEWIEYRDGPEFMRKGAVARPLREG